MGHFLFGHSCQSGQTRAQISPLSNNFFVFYLFKLKLGNIVELAIPKNPMFFFYFNDFGW